MSDLLRRIKRPRPAPAAEPASGFAASATAPAPPDASPGTGGPLLAGEDSSDPRPTTLRRGRLRKRLRFLERERELLLRDLGGLVYEIHRLGASGDREHHRTLVSGKVERLGGLDAELEAGLAALGEARGDTVLREPGIGGLCPRCGEIHGSDARFCSACGFPLEVAPTPGATTAHPPGGPAEAIVPAVGGPVVPVPASGTPAGADTDIFEDAPTRIASRRDDDTPPTGETGDRPPSHPELR